MNRLIADHLVSINQLAGAIQAPAMLNSEIQKSMRKATDFQPRVIEELLRQAQAEGHDAVRIRIEIEPMSFVRGREEFDKG